MSHQKKSKDQKLFLNTASDLHPYACILEKCPHCLRIVSENHNPKTCSLCNFEDWEKKADLLRIDYPCVYNDCKEAGDE